MHWLATKDQIEQEVDSYEGMGFLKKSKSVLTSFKLATELKKKTIVI